MCVLGPGCAGRTLELSLGVSLLWFSLLLLHSLVWGPGSSQVKG